MLIRVEKTGLWNAELALLGTDHRVLISEAASDRQATGARSSTAAPAQRQKEMKGTNHSRGQPVRPHTGGQRLRRAQGNN